MFGKCIRLSMNCAYAVAFVFVVLACDSGEDNEGKVDKTREAAAAAMLGGGDPVTDKARAEDEARRKEAFANRKAAHEAEEDRVQGILDTIAVLPTELPSSLDAACTAIFEPYQNFMLRTNAEDDGAILKWYEVKGKTLGERKAKCMKIGSIEAAACQANALDKAPADFKDRQLQVLSECVKKFAPDKAAAAAAAEPGIPK